MPAFIVTRDCVAQKGFSINYILTKGWVKKYLILHTNSTDRLGEMHMRGREGVKNP